MALSLDTLVRKRSDKPPRIVIYGPGGIGKTTLAAEFPAPIFLQTEDGSGDLDITSFADEPLRSYDLVHEALVALASEKHAFRTLVVDSLTRLEPLIWAETCARNGWQTIEEPGYGKGYLAADDVWRDFLKATAYLRDHLGMTVVMLAHESVSAFKDPTTDTYDRYEMRLQKRAEALIREEVDLLGFLNQVTMIRKEKKDFGKKDDYVPKGTGTGQRVLSLHPRPAFTAKCRFDAPDQVLINRGQGYAALAPYLPGHRDAKADAA